MSYVLCNYIRTRAHCGEQSEVDVFCSKIGHIVFKNLIRL